MTTDPKSTSRLEAFVSWFINQGGYIHPSTELLYTPSRGVHLRVKPCAPLPASHLTPGTLVISCPHSASLSALNPQDSHPFFPCRLSAFAEADRGFFAQLLAEARPQVVAAVWLCVQWREGDGSWWREYLDVLPGIPRDVGGDVGGNVGDVERGLGEVDSPVWWTEEEVSWVRGTNLERGKIELEAGWRNEWERMEKEVTGWAARRGWVLDW